MPEFSIIVPIYKVEKYLEICIDSIIGQSFCNFELISCGIAFFSATGSCGWVSVGFSSSIVPNSIFLIHSL